MIQKLKQLFHKHRSTLVYLVFGVLTTAVNYGVYFPLYNWAGLSAAVSNLVAWVVAVAFAYVTNKLFVFESKSWHREVVLQEITKFLGCRLASGVIETFAIYLTVDILGWNGNLMKLLLAAFTIAFNYVASKLFVFLK